MAYQNVVYRIINSLTSNCDICPLVVHKTEEMAGVKFWSQSNEQQLCCSLQERQVFIAERCAEALVPCRGLV